jgi:hypothetical protein
VAEVELIKWTPIDELERRLQRSLPPGLRLRGLREIRPVRKGRRPVEHRYRIHLRETQIKVDPRRLRKALEAKVLPHLRRQRPNRNQPPKKLDLRKSLANAALDASGDLYISVRPDPHGTLRPLELLSLLTEKPERVLKGVRVTRVLTKLDPPPNPASAQDPPHLS